jgi:hypothetical protein
MTSCGTVLGHRHTNQREIGKQKHWGSGRGFGLQGRPCKTMVLLGLLLMPLSLCAQTSNLSAPESNRQINNPVPLKLPVAHAHIGTWCKGNLTIAPDSIRYDVVKSHGKDDHSFSLNREEVLSVNYWVFAGQPINAVEIKTATKNYHFWLMQSARALDTHWMPIEAAASDSLLLSLYYWKETGNVPNLSLVNLAVARARLQLGTAMAQGGASGNGAMSNAYAKLNNRIYTNTYSQSSVSNQINSINHMSHW